jgi:2-polyprenyl-6-methoxyphenol hydroxylase-like FAD-dependent oxidoreductase
MLIMIPREGYFQIAYLIPKGSDAQLRARGLEVLKAELAELIPEASTDSLTSLDDVKCLDVKLNRLGRWHTDGLLCIGDAAHAMSPVGGVGINLAVQDAVAAANILSAALARHENIDPLLVQVEKRREFPTAVIQRAQKAVHDRVLTPLVLRKAVLDRVPLVLRLFERFPLLRRIPARLVGLGVRREHIRSPDAGLRR